MSNNDRSWLWLILLSILMATLNVGLWEPETPTVGMSIVGVLLIAAVFFYVSAISEKEKS